MTSETDKEQTSPIVWPTITKTADLCKTRDIARAIAGHGDDLRDIGTRIRGYSTRGYLSPVGRDADDKRGSLLFDDTAVLTAAVLREAAEAGLSDSNAMRLIGMVLQNWFGGQEPSNFDHPNAPRSPAEFIWRTLAADPDAAPGFAISVNFVRHIETGRRDVKVNLEHNVGGKIEQLGQMPAGDGWQITANLYIPIDPLLHPIWESLARIRGGH